MRVGEELLDLVDEIEVKAIKADSQAYLLWDSLANGENNIWNEYQKNGACILTDMLDDLKERIEEMRKLIREGAKENA